MANEESTPKPKHRGRPPKGDRPAVALDDEPMEVSVPAVVAEAPEPETPAFAQSPAPSQEVWHSSI